MRVARDEVRVDARGRDVERAARSGRVGLVEFDRALTSWKVPRTFVTIMCLAEKLTWVWAVSIFQVVMGAWVLRGVVARACGGSMLLLTMQPYRGYRCGVNQSPPRAEGVASRP